MKFPAIDRKNETLHIPSFCKGIKATDNTHSTPADSLSDCQNLWYKKGVLTSREGLHTQENMQLSSGMFSDGFYEAWNTIDTKIEIEGDIKSVVLERIEYDIAMHTYITHIINSDGTVFATPYMLFQRLDSYVFRIPLKVNFFKGKPYTGIGIFAMVYLVNRHDYTMQSSKIFELNSDYTEWKFVGPLYTPTVLVNGRGNRYDFAIQNDQTYLGVPTEVESINILDGGFNAYYSSDGYSWLFRLPYSDLENTLVKCRIYSSVDKYMQWNIETDRTSAVAKFYDVDITMHVNREQGIVYFENPNQEWPVPLFYNHNQNNICISASKKIPVSGLDLSKADACYSEGNTILLGVKNMIYETHCRNPVYFPLKNCITVGSEDSQITGFSKMGNNIAVFKKSEIYMLTINEGKLLNTPALLGNSNAVFYDADTYTVKKISSTVGCPHKNLIVNHHRHTYFLTDDNRIYSLDASGKITPLYEDLNILELLETTRPSGITAVALKNDIAFVASHKAVIFNKQKENELSCYLWQFPKELPILGAFSSKGELRLLCKKTGLTMPFIATLSGDRDMISLEERVDIPVSFRTSRLSLGCDSILKKINNIILGLKGSGKIFVNDRLQATVTQRDNGDFSRIRLSPSAYGVNTVDIAIEGTAPMAIGSMDINYTSLNI